MLVVIVFSTLIFLQSLGLYELKVQKEEYIKNKWNSFYDLSIQDRMDGYEEFRDSLESNNIMSFYEVDNQFPRLLALESESSKIDRLPIYRLDMNTDNTLIELLIGDQFNDINGNGRWDGPEEEFFDKHSIYLQKELMKAINVEENDVVIIRSAYSGKNNSIKDYKFPLIAKPINGKTRLKSFIFHNYIDGEYGNKKPPKEIKHRSLSRNECIDNNYSWSDSLCIEFKDAGYARKKEKEKQKLVRYEFSDQTSLFNFLFSDLVSNSFPTPFYIGHGYGEENDYENHLLLYYDPNTEMKFDGNEAPDCNSIGADYIPRTIMGDLKYRDAKIVDVEDLLPISNSKLKISKNLDLTYNACGIEVTQEIPIYCDKTQKLELRHRDMYNVFKSSCIESCIDDESCLSKLSENYVRKIQFNGNLEQEYNENCAPDSILNLGFREKRTKQLELLIDYYKNKWRQDSSSNIDSNIVYLMPDDFIQNKIEIKSASFIDGPVPDLFYIQYDFFRNALFHTLETRDKTQELIFEHAKKINSIDGASIRLIHSDETDVSKKNGKAVFAYYHSFDNKEQNKVILEKFDQLNIRWDNARWSKMIEIQEDIEKTENNIMTLIAINLIAFILVLIIKFMLRLKLELHLLGVLKCFGYSQGVIQFTYNVGNLLIILTGFIIGFFPVGILFGLISNFDMSIIMGLFLSEEIKYGVWFFFLLIFFSIVTTCSFINRYTEKENIYELIKYES